MHIAVTRLHAEDAGGRQKLKGHKGPPLESWKDCGLGASAPRTAAEAPPLQAHDPIRAALGAEQVLGLSELGTGGRGVPSAHPRSWSLHVCLQPALLVDAGAAQRAAVSSAAPHRGIGWEAGPSGTRPGPVPMAGTELSTELVPGIRRRCPDATPTALLRPGLGPRGTPGPP